MDGHTSSGSDNPVCSRSADDIDGEEDLAAVLAGDKAGTSRPQGQRGQITASYHLALISRLPPDLMREIFIKVRDNQMSENFLPGPDKRSVPYNNWVRSLTHVCRSWRRFAIESPLLWTHIRFPCAGPTTVATLLKRSRNAPLHIKGYVEDADMPLLLEVLESLPRISLIDICVNPDTVVQVLSVCRINRASILSAFHIQPYDHHIPTIRALVGSNVLSLFDGHNPLLRRVTLSHCTIGCDSSFLGGLVELNLCSLPHSKQLSVNDFLDVIAETPWLQILKLANYVKPTDPATTPAVPVRRAVPLNHLRLLYLEEHFHVIEAIAAHVSFLVPPVLEIYKSATYAYDRLPRSLLLGPLLRRTLVGNAIEGRVMRSLHLKFLYVEGRILLELGADSNETAARAARRNKLIRLHLDYMTYYPNYQFCVDLCRSMDMTGVRQVHLCQVHLQTVEQWVEFLQHLADAEVVYITGASRLLCDALVMSLGEAEGEGKAAGGFGLLPRLESLHLDSPSLNNEENMDQLRLWLTSRQRQGSVVRNLFIRQGHDEDLDYEAGGRFYSCVERLEFEDHHGSWNNVMSFSRPSREYVPPHT